MKFVQFDTFGAPASVLRIVEAEDPVPGPGQIVVRMLRMPVHPADLLLVEGRYGARPPRLPATPGAEGIGEVVACGPGVTTLAPGTRVSPLAGGLWRSLVVCKAEHVIVVPPDIDLDQAAMLKANPATAAALLDVAATAAPGMAIIQNAGNSAVGRLLETMATSRGIPVLSVVRHEDAAGHIRAEAPGARVVVDDGTDPARLPSLVAQGHADITLGFGIDAIGGGATDALAACLADGGTVVNFGRLSGRPCAVDPHHLIFRNITLRGFWLPTWFRAAAPETAARLYSDLIALVRNGSIRTPVEATYPLDRVVEAVAHAGRPGRTGKVMLSG